MKAKRNAEGKGEGMVRGYAIGWTRKKPSRHLPVQS